MSMTYFANRPTQFTPKVNTKVLGKVAAQCVALKVWVGGNAQLQPQQILTQYSICRGG